MVELLRFEKGRIYYPSGKEFDFNKHRLALVDTFHVPDTIYTHNKRGFTTSTCCNPRDNFVRRMVERANGLGLDYLLILETETAHTIPVPCMGPQGPDWRAEIVKTEVYTANFYTNI